MPSTFVMLTYEAVSELIMYAEAETHDALVEAIGTKLIASATLAVSAFLATAVIGAYDAEIARRELSVQSAWDALKAYDALTTVQSFICYTL